MIFGTVERLFFTLAVAFSVGGATVAMMAWLAVKMGANWGRVKEDDESIRLWSLCSALGGLFAMLLSLIGGIIIKKALGNP
jgi:hypothetical protein